MPLATKPTLVFDLGGVLIDWNPRYLYGKLFRGDSVAMERFLAEVCSPEWNLALDGGRPFAQGIDELVRRHPGQRALIETYWHRWLEMLRGPIHGTVDLLEALAGQGVPLFALTNWARETFQLIQPLPEYAFLGRFERIFVSGEMGVVKPDPEIYRRMLADLGKAPEACFFIDDNRLNVEGARRVGLRGHHFVTPEALRAELAGLGFEV
jgi:2-haloacid dehalogenase